MPIYKDFAGINICIYDPIEGDSGAHGTSTNIIGYDPNKSSFYTDNVVAGSNISNLTRTSEDNLLVILNLHRNGVWSYSSWSQTRASQCPLVRNQIKNNNYSFYGPGEVVDIQGTNYRKRYGKLEHKIEPMVSSKFRPVQYNFGFMLKDDRLAEFTLKAVLANECGFFTNDRMDELFTVKQLTTDDYEQAKAMYLDNALNNDTNPIDSIELVKYVENIYPRESNAFLSRTKQRDKYISGFWRTLREDRKYPLGKEHRRLGSVQGAKYDIYDPNTPVPNPSSWCLDARDNFNEVLTDFTIGFAGKTQFGVSGATSVGTTISGTPNVSFNRGFSLGSGILQNSFSQFAYFDQLGKEPKDGTNHMKDAPTYYHRHATIIKTSLYNPSGMEINSAGSTIVSAYMFSGDAFFNTPATRTVFNTTPKGQRSVVTSSRQPFYDTYGTYAEHIKLLGKDYTIVPEFIISENIDFYLNAGASEKNLPLLTVKGAKEGSDVPLENQTTQFVSPNTELPALNSDSSAFYNTYSNSDFLKMFDVVEVDNKDTLEPSVLKLTCKAIKKFRPHDGFYPAARTVQMAQQFYDSYSDLIKTENAGSQVYYDPDTFTSVNPKRVEMQSASAWTAETYSARLKPINTALFSPGILYNTIRSGIACDWPNIQAYYNYFTSSVTNGFSSTSGTIRTAHQGNYSTLVGEAFSQANLVADFHLIRPANTTSSADYSDFGDSMPYFHNRIPFEAITNPEGFLSSYSIVDTEAHPSGNTGLVNSMFPGPNDSRYKLMANNFLAEIPRFFLKRKRFSTFKSLRQGDPNFGILNSTGSLYGMRIKIRKSMQTIKQRKVTDLDAAAAASTEARNIFLPQDDPSETESITMYSRPSAFGPATCGISAPHKSDNDPILSTSFLDNDEYNHINGYNFPFTPPYYHGEAWCDIIFLPPSGSEGKLTIEQIFNNSRVFQLRFWQGNNNEFGTKLVNALGSTSVGSGIPSSVIEGFLSGTMDPGNISPNANAKGFISAGMQFSLHPTSGSIKSPINYNAMQVSSSVNLLTKFGSKDDVNSFNLGPLTIETNVDNDNDARWFIQSKFETPILNFNHITENDLSDGSLVARAQEVIPRGMWHQHGRIPAEDEGVFIEISDIPQDWFEETKITIYQSSWNDNTPGIVQSPVFPSSNEIKSLADLVGFPKNESIKMGELAEKKTIKEAIVAIPFREVGGRRKYFELDRKDVDSALRSLSDTNGSESLFVGKSIVDQITTMRQYVFPPEMDFLADSNIDPFAMYIFEFKHELTKQDLSDIWQNTMPDIGVTHELAETQISHELLSNELLGTKRKLSNASRPILDDDQTLFDGEIQWMVFKVKQKANKSYNNLIYGNQKEEIGLSYNWPYDYFSLVELVKLEAEVELSDIQEQNETRKPRKITSKRFRAALRDSSEDN